jgi:hypothetical protein
MKHAPAKGFIGAAIAGLLLVTGCSSSHDSPTSSGTSTITGSVVMGSSTQSVIRAESAAGLANIMVRVEPTGASTATDSAGSFALGHVAPGDVTLAFDRADVHARGQVHVPAGSTVAVTVTIHGNQASITPGGHPGAEIEGRVQTVDAGGGSLTVLDQRLGTVTVTTSTTTSIRHGALVLTLAQITVGMEVHVKAVQQADGSYLATEILVQDLVAGGTDASGSISSIDSGASTFVLHTSQGDVTIATNDATIYRRKGKAAAFSDLTVGARIEVKGTIQNDGSILAQEVTIDG